MLLSVCHKAAQIRVKTKVRGQDRFLVWAEKTLKECKTGDVTE